MSFLTLDIQYSRRGAGKWDPAENGGANSFDLGATSLATLPEHPILDNVYVTHRQILLCKQYWSIHIVLTQHLKFDRTQNAVARRG